MPISTGFATFHEKNGRTRGRSVAQNMGEPEEGRGAAAEKLVRGVGGVSKKNTH